MASQLAMALPQREELLAQASANEQAERVASMSLDGALHALAMQTSVLGGKSYPEARRDLDGQITSIKTISSQKNQEQRRISSLEVELAQLEAQIAASQANIATTTSLKQDPYL